MLTRRIAPVLLLGLLAVTGAQTLADGGHSISVKLLDAATGKPVKNVWVLPRELREPSRFRKCFECEDRFPGQDSPHLYRCPKCGGPMKVIERLTAAEIQLRSPPAGSIAA